MSDINSLIHVFNILSPIVLQSVTECYRVLQSIAEFYRVLQSVTERYRVLQSITEKTIVLQSLQTIREAFKNVLAEFVR